jgi:hypothetical protein
MKIYGLTSTISIIFITFLSSSILAQPASELKERLSQLERYNPDKIKFKGDWLIQQPDVKAKIYYSQNNCLILSNGLISRTFSLMPDGSTVGFDNLSTNVSLFRAVKPEASIIVDGHTIHVGGLVGQPVMNYFLDSWLNELSANEAAMHIKDFRTNPIKAPFEWKKSWIGCQLTYIGRPKA